MKVKIIDPNHPYCGETGILRSKLKVAGRKLFVYMDDYLSETEISKEQVQLI